MSIRCYQNLKHLYHSTLTVTYIIKKQTNKFFRKNKKGEHPDNIMWAKYIFKNVYIKRPLFIFRNQSLWVYLFVFFNTESKRFSHASSLLSVCSSQMDKRENVAQLSVNTTLFAYAFTLHAKI